MEKREKPDKISVIQNMTLIVIVLLGVIPIVLRHLVSQNTIGAVGDTICVVCLAWIILVTFIGIELKKWIVQDQCDFETYEVYLKRRIGKRKNRVLLHLELLFTSLVLEKYEESREEIKILHSLDSRMNKEQRLRLHLLSMDYKYAMGEYASSSQEEDVETAMEMLKKCKGMWGRRRKQYRDVIELRRCLIEEEWQDALRLLVAREKPSVYEQMYCSYTMGRCYYELGKYEAAFRQLEVVSKWVGVTKFAAGADALLEKIPNREWYETGDQKQEKRIGTSPRCYKIAVAVIMGLLWIGFAFASYAKTRGGSIEEVYAKRYHAGKETEAEILYQDEADGYVVAILNDNQDMAYCLLKKKEKASGTEYIIYDRQLLTQKAFQPDSVDLYTLERASTDTENMQDSVRILYQMYAENEATSVIEWFYKRNAVFKQGSFALTGVSYNPYMADLKIADQPVAIVESIEAGDMEAYIWKVENVNPTELELKDVGIR